MVLPVKGLQHHEALFSGEGLLDTPDPGLQPLLQLPLLGLHGVGPAVERQHQEIHPQAQDDDAESLVAEDPEAQGIEHVEQQLQGADQYLI